MLKGIVEKRLAPRVAFQAELKLRLEKDGQTLSFATATDVSTGGIRFYTPGKMALAKLGEQIEFVFNPPSLGPTTVRAEILHLKNGLDSERKPAMYYGVKFLDLNLEAWNHISEYCRLMMGGGGKPVESAAAERSPRLIPRTDNKGSEQDLPIAHLQMKNGRSFRCQIEEISFAGLQVRLLETLPVGGWLTIMIRHENKSINLEGACVWCYQTGNTGLEYTAGIRLMVLNKGQHDNLREYLVNYDQITHRAR